MVVAVGETVVLGNTVVKAASLYQVAIPTLHEAESNEDCPAQRALLEADTVGKPGKGVTVMSKDCPAPLHEPAAQAA